jgi:hypothetical protein
MIIALNRNFVCPVPDLRLDDGATLRDGSPSFYTYVYSPPVSVLQGKGLVWTPGGTHHQDHYPFSFHDFAWHVLVKRNDEFIAKHAEFKRVEEERKKAERRSRGY